MGLGEVEALLVAGNLVSWIENLGYGGGLHTGMLNPRSTMPL